MSHVPATGPEARGGETGPGATGTGAPTDTAAVTTAVTNIWSPLDALPPAEPPPDLPRRVRRRATRLRALRLAAAVAAAAGLAGLVAVLPPGGGTGPGPDDNDADDIQIVEPLPQPPKPAPRVPVGVAGVAWISQNEYDRNAVWCVGGPEFPDAAAVIHSCRYLPPTGRLDTVVLEPGQFAPADHKLVVAVLAGLNSAGMPASVSISDAAGTRDLVIAQPPGMPGVVVVWGFTTGDRRDIRVIGADGNETASCRACVPGR